MKFSGQTLFRKMLLSQHWVILLVAALLILITALFPSFMSSFENHFMKVATAVSGGLEPAPEISIVGIDERSVKELGNWPWSDKTLSRLIDKLDAMKANLISIDASVVDDTDLRRLYLSKRQLEKPTIIMGYSFYPSLADVPPDDKEKTNAWKKQTSEGKLDGISLPSKPSDDSKLMSMLGIDRGESLLPPGDGLREGFSNIFPDSNGIVARHPLAVRFHDRIFPALPVVIYSRWKGYTPIMTESTGGHPTGISIGDEGVRTGADAMIAIGFRGSADTFPHISASDVIEGRASEKDISGRIILVGLTSKGLGEFYETAVGRMDDLEITANVLDNLLHKRGLLSLTGRMYVIPLILILGLIFAFGVSRLSQSKKLAATLILLAAFWTAGLMLFWSADILFPTIQLSIAAILFIVSLMAWQMVVRDLPRHRLTMQFAGRLNKSAIEDILADTSLIESTGRKIEITALAIDIKGFGSIADKLSPKALTKFVKEYRTLASKTLLRHGAMITSWVGDDIRAAFGAPVPLEEHELRACLAALELRRAISSNKDKWNENFGVERLRIGVGIQTGMATAGNFGGGYNIIGGAMEAACQLRSLNRTYRTWALVGNSTYSESSTAMQYRQLDPVMLWGEKAPTLIHELIGETGTILPSIKGYDEARMAYIEGDFERAIELFKDILDSHPHDGPSRLFLKRAAALRRKPPEAWTGLWR